MSFHQLHGSITLVRKKDGLSGFCVDYQKLNDVTIKDSYLFVRLINALMCLLGANGIPPWTCAVVIGKPKEDWKLSISVQSNEFPSLQCYCNF